MQHKYGTGKYVTLQCSETVGTQSVSISLSSAGPGGFGGVSNIKTTHPSGLGAGASLITGKAVPSGGPVDFVEFHRGTVYVDLSANGATRRAHDVRPAGLQGARLGDIGEELPGSRASGTSARPGHRPADRRP